MLVSCSQSRPLHSGVSVTIQIMKIKSITRVLKSYILLAGMGVWKISSVAYGFSSQIDYSDDPRSLISRINEVYVFFNKISPYFIEKKLHL